MSVSTLRPDGTVSNVGGVTATGAASLHAALSDDSDASYTNPITDRVIVSLGDFTLPAGAVVKSFAVRARLSASDAVATLYFTGGIGTDDSGPYLSTITWSSPTTVTVLGPVNADAASWPHDVPWNEATVDVATIQVDPGINTSRIYELYADITYVTQPVASVTAPVDPVSDTNLPAVTWANTLDSDGGAQTRYEVKVFTDAQYGAGGFDPDTSTPFETSGEMSSAAATWTPSTLQADDTYRAYVRVAQTVAGALHWSDWDFIEYDLAVALPAVPTLTLTEDENDGRIVIDLDDNAGDATTDAFELQRSTDGGTTWEAVRLTTDTAGVVTGTSATVYDYEAPNGTATQYRARALHNYAGLYAASAWATGTVTFSTADVWLKAPERPSLNVVVQIHVDGYSSRQRPARRGVFQPLGRTYPIVVRDTRQSWAGTVRFRLDTDEDQAPIDALLDSGLTLLLQVPDRYHEPDRYVHLGDQDRGRLADKGFVEGVIDTLGWVEVAAPTGVVDAWPVGTS